MIFDWTDRLKIFVNFKITRAVSLNFVIDRHYTIDTSRFALAGHIVVQLSLWKHNDSYETFIKLFSHVVYDEASPRPERINTIYSNLTQLSPIKFQLTINNSPRSLKIHQIFKHYIPFYSISIHRKSSQRWKEKSKIKNRSIDRLIKSRVDR